MDYSWVLRKCITGFTHVHYHLSVITCKYYTHDRIHLWILPVSTKMHDKNYSQVFSIHQQSLMSSVLLVPHEPNMQVAFKFSWGLNRYSHSFVNFDMSCTVLCGNKTLPYRYHLSEAEERCNGWKHKRWCCSDRPAFAHVGRLESTLISCLYRGLNI